MFGASQDQGDKHRLDFVKDATACMQAAFLMRSAGKKLLGYGQNAQQRCRKDPQETLMKLMFHQQSTLKKGMQKLQAAKAMMEATEECDVMSFDIKPLEAFQANQEWKECIEHLANESRNTMEKLAEDMASSSKSYGASCETSWKKDLLGADWATVRRTAEKTIQQLDGSQNRNLCNAFQKELAHLSVTIGPE